MKLYSTRNRQQRFSLKEAVLKGLPDDNGLFMPEQINRLPDDFFSRLPKLSFPDLSFEVAHHLLGEAIPEKDLRPLVEEAINFPAPVIKLDDQVGVLELFHGPSLAFKDFGARFMARLMSYFNRDEKEELVILVATSGDTGGAVAAGFYQTPGIRVVILYPSGKVSLLQEKQLTTLGHNIAALEIDGSFDDCQALVKQAFLDPELNRRIRLSSANSINIARLIPQSFYYFEAFKQVAADKRPLAFCVPSGNFGNLTAGLLAAKMGLPVAHFIAATNANDVVPQYLEKGVFTPRPSIPTLSNAMDVGNPSNFARMLDLYVNNEENPERSTWNIMKEQILGFAFPDSETEETIREVFQKYHYLLDPHGAVGYLGLKKYLETYPGHQGIILETAHPAKFKPDVERVLGRAIQIPERLAVLADLPKEATFLTTAYPEFKSWLLKNY